mgnify:CR=1 FL=1
MKKVAIVLLMGLAIGMTFMSCSKEEIVAEEIATCGELGYTITGLNVRTVEGYDLYSINILDWAGGTFTLNINKDKWEAYRLEFELNGLACWGV